jgi:hypothetical protein
MNFPQYWALGKCRGYSSWRSSDRSLAEAQSEADVAAQKLAALFESGAVASLRHTYYGTDRPQREQVLRRIPADSGGAESVITRNSYGCLVLNTAQIMFVDVDLPQAEPVAGAGSWLGRFFGRAKPTAPPALGPDAMKTELLARAAKALQRQPDWGWRVYRTRAGYRLLATHELFEPAGLAEQVFEELGADPLYRQLCRIQKCYRARLTPKPWRCGMGQPESTWPWPNAKMEEAFNRWNTRYLAACEGRATCELIATLGNPEVHAAIQPIVALHDETTRALSKLPLA